MKIYLAGTPNSGKTTLFNRLTGSRHRVGNRAGVTVCEKNGTWAEHTLTDLPGLYSLSDSGAEEQISVDFLKNGHPDWILNLADASNFSRALPLTLELGKLGVPMILALNFCDRAEQSGQQIDPVRLSDLLRIPVVMISAHSGAGISELASLTPTCMQKNPLPPDQILKKVLVRSQKNNPIEKSARADQLLLGSVFALPILFSVLFLILYFCFGSIGAFFTRQISRIFSDLESLVLLYVPNIFLQRLFCGGILSSLSGIVGFFPQLFLLFFCLSILEESGYLARIGFLSHGFLSPIELDGQCILPLLFGFGCSVPAMLTARTVRSEKSRQTVLYMLPYLPCSAKFPVFFLLSASAFPSHAGLAVCLFYLLGICFALLTAFLRREKTVSISFLAELPPYRLPHWRTLLQASCEKITDFFRRSGWILLFSGLLLWLLQSFDWKIRLVSPEDSMLAILGRLIAPIFSPCGFGEWRYTVSLLAGLTAKEAVLSSLQVLSAPDFSPAAAVSFLCFLLFSPPCFAALSTLRKESSKPILAKFILQRFLLAWCLSAFIYQISSRIGWLF